MDKKRIEEEDEDEEHKRRCRRKPSECDPHDEGDSLEDSPGAEFNEDVLAAEFNEDDDWE